MSHNFIAVKRYVYDSLNFASLGFGWGESLPPYLLPSFSVLVNILVGGEHTFCLFKFGKMTFDFRQRCTPPLANPPSDWGVFSCFLPQSGGQRHIRPSLSLSCASESIWQQQETLRPPLWLGFRSDNCMIWPINSYTTTNCQLETEANSWQNNHEPIKEKKSWFQH